MTKPTCPICEEATLQERKTERQFVRGKQSFSYVCVDSICVSCGAELMQADQSLANRRAMVTAERALVKAPEPEKIRKWRKLWGISQENAGKMFGTGKTSFSKYENGAMLPSQPTINFLDLCMASHDATKKLAGLHGIPLSADPSALDNPEDCTETILNCQVVPTIDLGGKPAHVVKHLDLVTPATAVISLSKETFISVESKEASNNDRPSTV